ncbi:probable F420-dependent oxidoreductase, Rv1855c family [Streptosporangium subroseum]|uniref:Probable F420-dependent oxidoreductase, Rv1855c family n=1 Tax=Streptosporangium subroseum TaxID=106412 RepID=A0A239I075_9ACTN|nr:LLM class F420-dependent oxidoreductase [Streptosporangium subroseum]SNS86891.1 probable F420-dependent oxidoreductase, Rv1855c family [Streptosporangium subroseum]
MKLGLTCPRFTWLGGDTAIAGRFADVARGAEGAGLHSLWVMDHFFQIPNFGAVEDPMLEAYGALSYAAALTDRVTLGALVTGAVYREPGLLVKQVSTLDALSGGRAVLGIGAGWYEPEARGLGLRFPSLAERFERLEETLQIARQMWSDEDKPYEGRHYRLERTLNAPQASPPILIGGSGEKKTLRLVAEYADACNFLYGADVPHKLGVLRAHCERLGRPYEEIEKTLHLRIPDGQSVEESVQRCGDLAALGIDHVIAAVPDAAADSSLAHLAALAAQISAITPAGR